MICKYTHDRLWMLLQYKLAMQGQPHPSDGQPHPSDVGKTLLDYILPQSSAVGKDSGDKQTKAKSKRHREKKPNRRRRKLSHVSSSESESEGIASVGSSSDDSLVCDFEENLSEHEPSVDLLESLSDSSDKEMVQSSSAVHDSPFQKGRRQIVLAANFSSSQVTQVKETAQTKPMGQNEKSKEEMCKAVHKVCDLLVQEDCLVMIKMFSDWLQTYPSVIATCAQVQQLLHHYWLYCYHVHYTITQSMPQLWSHLAQLLNILPTEAQLLSVGK